MWDTLLRLICQIRSLLWRVWMATWSAHISSLLPSWMSCHMPLHGIGPYWLVPVGHTGCLEQFTSTKPACHPISWSLSIHFLAFFHFFSAVASFILIQSNSPIWPTSPCWWHPPKVSSLMGFPYQLVLPLGGPRLRRGQSGVLLHPARDDQAANLWLWWSALGRLEWTLGHGSSQSSFFWRIDSGHDEVS